MAVEEIWHLSEAAFMKDFVSIPYQAETKQQKRHQPDRTELFIAGADRTTVLHATQHRRRDAAADRVAALALNRPLATSRHLILPDDSSSHTSPPVLACPPRC